MTKKFNKYAIIIVTILLAELIHAYAFSYLSQWTSKSAPYISTALAMTIAVIAFFIAFKFIERYLKGLSNKYIMKSRRVIGRNFASSLISFLFALFLLFIAYAQVWFSKNIITDIKIWISQF